MSTTAPEQPEQGQDPQEPTTAAPAAPAPAVPTPAGDGPWAQDLATRFPDPAQRATVDEFLRSTVQPYTTQLEQRAQANERATKLWGDLETAPLDTYVAVTNEMFGEDAANALLATLQEQMNEAEAGTPEATEPVVSADPRLADALEWVENQRNQAYYDGEINRLKTTPDYSDVKVDYIHPFVAAAGGDFDQAVVLYREFVQQFGQEPTTAAAVEAAPQALGSDTQAAQASSTPVEQKKQTIGEAIEEFVRETRPNAAPPVGSI